MMDQLIREVTDLVGEEYQRAAAKFGPKNNSPHESYAVLLEETEEAQEQISVIQSRMDAFWLTVKGDAIGATLMSCENAKAAEDGRGLPWPLVPIYDVSVFCDLGFEPLSRIQDNGSYAEESVIPKS